MAQRDNNNDLKLIRYLLENEGVPLPESLLRGEVLYEIERTIKHPALFAETLKWLAKSLPEQLPEEELRKFFYYMQKYDGFTEGYELSDDDIKIINFLTDKTETKERYVLEMIGPFYFMGRISDEVSKNEDLPKILAVTSFLYVFTSSYELLLHMVDRRLTYYLTEGEGKDIPELKSEKVIKNFLKGVENRETKKEYMTHATAGELKRVLGVLIDENLDKSIFGSNSEVKMLRNKISHINLFYDDKLDKIVVGTREYTYENLLQAYFTIFRFFIIWGKKIFGIETEFDIDRLISQTYSDIRHMLHYMATFWKKIQRSGEMKRIYYAWVIRWTEEAKQN